MNIFTAKKRLLALSMILTLTVVVVAYFQNATNANRAVLPPALIEVAGRPQTTTQPTSGETSRAAREQQIMPPTNQLASGSTRKSEATAVTVEQREPSPAFIAWEKRVGYILPQSYNTMTEVELQNRSDAGDMFASQRLARIAMTQHKNIQQAVELYKKSAGQGSLAGLAELENIYNPTIAKIVAGSYPEFRDFAGDQSEAYLWARVAAMRGDPDALMAIAEHSTGLNPQEILEIERNAVSQYILLQEQYRRLTGHPFNNDFIDPAQTPLGQSRVPQNGGD